MLSYTIDAKWQQQAITWSFAAFNYTVDAGREVFSHSLSPVYQTFVQRAFQEWSAVSGLVFTQEADSNAVDIRIGFANLNTAATGTVGLTSWLQHGPFLAPDVLVGLEDPGQLPLVFLNGALTYQGYSAQFYQVVLHELGHALGLGHSSDPFSVMYPTMTANNQDLDLTDVAGIDAIYNAEITPASLGRPVFRFFDIHDGGHFFTTSSVERDQVLATRPDLRFEKVGYDAVNPASNDPHAAPVYRFFDTHDGGHFFTISLTERDQVLATRPDLKFEGVGYSEHATQQAGDSPVYRFFETTSGGHFFTESAVERNQVMATRSDMRFEGIAFWAPA